MAESKNKKRGTAKKSGEAVGGKARKESVVVKGFGKGLSRRFSENEKK
jgi:hypothetical protein